jgi:hypothetical protein
MMIIEFTFAWEWLELVKFDRDEDYPSSRIPRKWCHLSQEEKAQAVYDNAFYEAYAYSEIMFEFERYACAVGIGTLGDAEERKWVWEDTTPKRYNPETTLQPCNMFGVIWYTVTHSWDGETGRKTITDIYIPPGQDIVIHRHHNPSDPTKGFWAIDRARKPFVAVWTDESGVVLAEGSFWADFLEAYHNRGGDFHASRGDAILGAGEAPADGRQYWLRVADLREFYHREEDGYWYANE